MKTKIISAILIFSMLFSLATVNAYWDENNYNPNLPELSGPTNLKWHVDANGNSKKGYVSWDAVQGCEGEYYICLMRDGEKVYETHWSDLYDKGSGRVGIEFIHTNEFNKTGAYTFSVQPVGDGIKYNNGPTVTSGVYNFVCPSKKLAEGNGFRYNARGL